MPKCIFIPVLAAALLIAGCGDSTVVGTDGQITVKTGSLTKAQFIKRADAVCRTRVSQAHRGFETFVKRNKVTFASPVEQEELGREVVIAVIIPPLEKQIEQIRSIGAPDGDEKQVASILIAIQEALNRGKANPREIIGGSGFARSSTLAQEYGLTVCGSV